jgi:hypothetical protein
MGTEARGEGVRNLDHLGVCLISSVNCEEIRRFVFRVWFGDPLGPQHEIQEERAGRLIYETGRSKSA